MRFLMIASAAALLLLPAAARPANACGAAKPLAQAAATDYSAAKKKPVKVKKPKEKVEYMRAAPMK